jgi:hypothetical protein
MSRKFEVTLLIHRSDEKGEFGIFGQVKSHLSGGNCPIFNVETDSVLSVVEVLPPRSEPSFILERSGQLFTIDTSLGPWSLARYDAYQLRLELQNALDAWAEPISNLLDEDRFEEVRQLLEAAEPIHGTEGEFVRLSTMLRFLDDDEDGDPIQEIDCALDEAAVMDVGCPSPTRTSSSRRPSTTLERVKTLIVERDRAIEAHRAASRERASLRRSLRVPQDAGRRCQDCEDWCPDEPYEWADGSVTEGCCYSHNMQDPMSFCSDWKAREDGNG